jgi:hypothetical protein
MALSSVYRKYFQKSKVFLYPLLGIKRGTSVTPIETYLSWNDTYVPEDMKLICVYCIRTDAEYLQFEKNVLLKHTRLSDYVKIDDETAVYTFDFSDLGADWNHFMDGKYSKITVNLKQQIINFFDKNSGNYTYMHSYLFPEKYFSEYAELLGAPLSLITSVGELCSKPDLEQEKLKLEIANLDNISDSKLNLEEFKSTNNE